MMKLEPEEIRKPRLGIVVAWWALIALLSMAVLGWHVTMLVAVVAGVVVLSRRRSAPADEHEE